MGIQKYFANSIKRQFTGLDKAIKTGVGRALNKALNSTKSELAKTIKSETGLKTEVLKSRILALKASNKNLRVSLNLAVKVGIPLRYFSPSLKMVKAGKRGKRKYQGVSVKIGSSPRAIAPGAFALDNSRGIVVVGRKDAFYNGEYLGSVGRRKPIVQLRSQVFLDSAQANKDKAQSKLHERFDKIVNHEIEFAISQCMASNK